jgi:hypothetical protein
MGVNSKLLRMSIHKNEDSLKYHPEMNFRSQLERNTHYTWFRRPDREAQLLERDYGIFYTTGGVSQNEI